MNSDIKGRGRFPGLELSDEDRAHLRALKRKGGLSARLWRRIRILELLDARWNLTDTAHAVGTYRREVRRVGWRFLEQGLTFSLGEQPRAAQTRKLDHRQESEIIAMLCSDPPEGASRWTIRLTLEESIKRGIVDSIGDETIRRLFLRHDFKPWRKKNVVRTQA